MPTRGHIARVKPTPAPVDLGEGDVINVVFDRNRITEAWLDQAMLRDEALSIADSVAKVIISWDITEDDGSPFPPTKENLGEVLSLDALRSFFVTLREAAYPPRAEGNALSQPSSSPSTDFTPPAPTPQNSTAPSVSPAVSASPSPT
jgi:hypothetical protein